MSHTPSRSRSHRTQLSATYLPNEPEDLALSAGVVGEEVADILNHSGPHRLHEVEETRVDQSEEVVDMRERAARPWWKRPAPWW
jgi:hypothetical protein